jgi:exonuclease SbcC
MVFELAAMLEDGAPCPVCGALDHPDPSEVRGERVTRDDEDAASAEADRARREVEELAARRAAAQADRDGLHERLGEQAALGVAGLRALLVAQGTAEEALTREAERVDLLAERLLHADEEQAEAEAERAALREQATAAARRAVEAQDRAAAAEAAIAEELDGAADLDAALRDVGSATAACERARAALDTVDRAVAEHERAARELVLAAAEAGFASVDDAAAAVREPAWTTGTTARLRAADDERAAVEALLADPALDVPLDPPADVAAPAAALREADAVLAAAVEARATAADRAAALETLVPELEAATDALAPLASRADEVRRLADLAAGQGANAMRMTLSSYVLAARLEEVAAAASERLLRMSQGRYSLVHTDEGRGGARAGLGLLARDTWTGQDRDTSTLSGGETFLASLALALGLADVVTAEAGGTRIEALFVDEGFGTLDEVTLDEVMDVLDGLREGGRVVGLVSHVAELRARIPAQVRLHKGRAGSTLSVVGC